MHQHVSRVSSAQTALRMPSNSSQLPTDLWRDFCTMNSEQEQKKARVNEAFPFMDFPLKDLMLRKPIFETKSTYSIPALKDSVRNPFVNLTPNKGEWLRICFDVDVEQASTQKDAKGTPLAFKLVYDVKDKQEEFMKELDKRFQDLLGPSEKRDWMPILVDKIEYASSISMRVNLRSTCIKIYDGKELRTGKGWDFVKDFRFQNSLAKVAFLPVRVWEKDGKAGVALEAAELVLHEGEGHAKKVDECFSLDAL